MPDTILDQVRAEQEAQQDDAKNTAFAFDRLTLEEIVNRWGIETVLQELEQVQKQARKGFELYWRILSPAYLSGGYDDPNPCSCDDLF